MFLAAVALVSAVPATKTFDAATFTVPAGFEFTQSPDHVNFRRIDPTNWLLFGIYKGRAATRDLSTEFITDWNDLLREKGAAAPTPVGRKVGSGNDAREGGALTSVGYQQLIDVDAGGSVVSIIVESGNAEGFTTYRKTIDAVLASLVVKRAPRSAPVANATPAATEAVETRTFDAATFIVPAGFDFTVNPDHVNFRRVDPTNWLQFGIYQGRAMTGRLPMEFAADWNHLFGRTGVAPPTPVARKVGSGVDASEGGALTSIGYVQLIDVDAGGSVISILVESGNAEGFTTYRTTIDGVLASLVVRPTPKSTPTTNGAPAVTPPPAPTAVQIHLSDLVGVWDYGSSSTTTYALLESGEYAGAASHFFATEYTLTADGKFTSRYMATHPPINFHSVGTWGFEEGLFVISEGGNTKHFQIATFGPAPDGRKKMSLVREGVVVNEYTQTDDWYRATPKGTAPK